jgi:hypothetical protein
LNRDNPEVQVEAQVYQEEEVLALEVVVDPTPQVVRDRKRRLS